VYDTSTNFLNVHEWAYGLTEVAHILSLAVSIGLIGLVDLRLIGFGPRHVTPARLLRATAVGTVAGLVVAVTSGLLIASTDPIRYFNHPVMRLKLLLVVAGIVFNYAIHNRVALGVRSPAAGRTVALLSLTIWTTTVFGGIFYAFT
jgi:hypothetical protein